MTSKFVKPGQAEKFFGVHRRTIKKWADEGHILSFRPGGTGQRLYDVSTAACFKEAEGVAVRPAVTDAAVEAIYARVSTRKQTPDLERQLAALRLAHPGARVFSDVGSGLNFKRRGLRDLIKLAFAGKLKRVYVAHRDRLCRFAYDLVEYVLAHHGATIVVDGDAEGTSDEQELAEDVLSVITVFGAKLHGKRSGQGRRRRAAEEAAAGAQAEAEGSSDSDAQAEGGSDSDAGAQESALVPAAPQGAL